MKVITKETLYHEDYGATLKHKCGKRIVALSHSGKDDGSYYSLTSWCESPDFTK